MASEEHPAETFRRFVGTFTARCHPELLALSGGEALLRPELVRELAEQARSVGTRTSVLSGLYFARGARRIPPAIHTALRAVDHVSVSIDVFHEREVPRADVFRVLAQLLDEGKDLSLHIVACSERDAYVDALVADVRAQFGDWVPMLVNLASSFGRAREWLTRKLPAPSGVAKANPCLMAAWPVVGFDGTIVACGNDDALDERPAHLCLGHAAVDDWETIRARSLGAPLLRAIRLYGPEALVARAGERGCSGTCETCMAVVGTPAVAGYADAHMREPSTRIVEREAARLIQEAGAHGFVHCQTLGRYAELMNLGA